MSGSELHRCLRSHNGAIRVAHTPCGTHLDTMAKNKTSHSGKRKVPAGAGDPSVRIDAFIAAWALRTGRLPTPCGS